MSGNSSSCFSAINGKPKRRGVEGGRRSVSPSLHADGWPWKEMDWNHNPFPRACQLEL